MPRRILVPLDGTPESEVVLGHLTRLGRPGDEVTLFHCVPRVTPPVGVSPAEALLPAELAEGYLLDVSRRYPRFTVQSRVEGGDPAARIAAAAREFQVDFVAMTTHARRGLRRWLLGSVAERVTLEIDLPVLLVRPDLWAPTRPAGRFLVPVDLSPADEPVLNMVKAFAGQTPSEALLLHVVPITVVTDPVTGFTPRPRIPDTADLTPVLEARRRELEGSGWAVQTALVWGDVAEQILERAHTFRADGIFMARAPRAGLERWLSGSVTEQVLRKAECPVVLRRILRAWPDRPAL